MKTKLQRWSCKKLIACCVGPLWDWVHEGDPALRLHCFRHLGGVPDGTTLPSDTDEAESVDSLVVQCRVHIVETLMRYAQGTDSPLYQKYWKDELESKRKTNNSPVKNYRRVYPYGPAAARTKEGFLEIPFTFYATTLACVYTFLAVDKEMWAKVCTEYSYPMTKLWPEGQIRKVVHFVMKCKTDLTRVFDSYEENGGEYYGPENNDAKDTRRTRLISRLIIRLF